MIKPIDMLNVFGKIYSKTAAGYAQISLSSILMSSESEDIRKKAKHISTAMTKMGLLVKDGKNHRYRWNRQEFGVPTIPLAERVIREADELQTVYSARAAEKLEAAKRRTFHISIKRKARNKVTCEGCPYTDACDVFASLGINCKAYDLNTIEYETTMGCQG